MGREAKGLRCIGSVKKMDRTKYPSQWQQNIIKRLILEQYKFKVGLLYWQDGCRGMACDALVEHWLKKVGTGGWNWP